VRHAVGWVDEGALEQLRPRSAASPVPALRRRAAGLLIAGGHRGARSRPVWVGYDERPPLGGRSEYARVPHRAKTGLVGPGQLSIEGDDLMMLSAAKQWIETGAAAKSPRRPRSMTSSSAKFGASFRQLRTIRS
jgi:hypothetical protein